VVTWCQGSFLRSHERCEGGGGDNEKFDIWMMDELPQGLDLGFCPAFGQNRDVDVETITGLARLVSAAGLAVAVGSGESYSAIATVIGCHHQERKTSMRLLDSRELDGRVFKGVQETTNACGMSGFAKSGPTNEWVARFELTSVTGDWYGCGWEYC